MTVMLEERFRLHNVVWYNFLNARSFMKRSCVPLFAFSMRTPYFPRVLSWCLFCWLEKSNSLLRIRLSIRCFIRSPNMHRIFSRWSELRYIEKKVNAVFVNLWDTSRYRFLFFFSLCASALLSFAYILFDRTALKLNLSLSPFLFFYKLYFLSPSTRLECWSRSYLDIPSCFCIEQFAFSGHVKVSC